MKKDKKKLQFDTFKALYDLRTRLTISSQKYEYTKGDVIQLPDGETALYLGHFQELFEIRVNDEFKQVKIYSKKSLHNGNDNKVHIYLKYENFTEILDLLSGCIGAELDVPLSPLFQEGEKIQAQKILSQNTSFSQDELNKYMSTVIKGRDDFWKLCYWATDGRMLSEKYEKELHTALCRVVRETLESEEKADYIYFDMVWDDVFSEWKERVIQ